MKYTTVYYVLVIKKIVLKGLKGLKINILI